MNSKILSPEYYFKKIDDFPFPEIFETDFVWEILERKDEILKKEVDEFYEVEGKYVIKGPVHIGRHVDIKPFTVIEAKENSPVYIGDNCKIGPHAYIRHGTLIGDGVEIGRTEVKGSVILNGTKSHHHGYIGDSIIGREVNIGTSFDSGNLKHTGSNVRVKGVDTKRRKFGCVIGDYSKIGCKTTLYPGTLLGPNVWTEEGCVIKGFVPENTFVRCKMELEFEELKKEYRK